jgi:VIT1/CCC1 family predicted Fe2+/Mn2+ transporter
VLRKIVIAGHYPRDDARIGEILGKYLEHGDALERSRAIAMKNITSHKHLVNAIVDGYLKHFFKSVALYPHPLLMGGIHAGRNRIPQMQIRKSKYLH